MEGQTAAADNGGAAAAKAAWPWPALLATVVLVAIPLARMADLVRHSSRTQYNDYWFMIDGTFRRNGWFDVSELFRLRNGHPVVIPKLIYWINARVTGGSNVTLGVIVLGLALAQLVILASLLDRRKAIVSRVLVVAAFSALLFAPQAAWSFVRSMSGTAWLSANLLAVIAISLRWRAHRFGAAITGVAATLSYTTGLLVWPALLSSGFLRDRKLRSEWPIVVGAVISSGWFLERRRHYDQGDNLGNTTGPFRNAASIVGSVFAPDRASLARNVGLAVMAIAIVLAILAMRSDRRSSAPWVGLLVYSLGSAWLIGFGRNDPFGHFTASRYCAVGALVCLSALGLATLVTSRTAVHVLLDAAIIVASSVAGGETVDEMRDGKPEQDLLAIALRLDLADDTKHWYAIFGSQFPDVTSTLEAFGHYPFDGRFHADCGLLGKRLPAGPGGAGEPQRVGRRDGRVSVRPMRGVPDAVQITGRTKSPAKCIVVVDASRQVVGAGITGYRPGRPNRSPETAFTAIAPVGQDPYEVYAVFRG